MTLCAILLKVTLLYGCFSRFLNCKNSTKSRKASHYLKKIKLTTCLIYNAVPILMTLTLLPTLMTWKHNYSGREIQPFPFQGFLVRPPPYPHPSNVYVESCPLHRFSIHLSGYIQSLVPPLIKSLKKKTNKQK